MFPLDCEKIEGKVTVLPGGVHAPSLSFFLFSFILKLYDLICAKIGSKIANAFSG